MPTLSNNELTLTIRAIDDASKDLQNVKKKIEELGSEADSGRGSAEGLGSAWDKIRGVGRGVAVAVGAAAVAVGGLATVGFGNLINYSFNATKEVQSYVAGIKGLTTSTEEASDVIKSMVDYVQGKPFDRIEVLGATRNLLVFGRSASEAKADIELLGRAVVISGSDFESLSQIYGRVASSGRLMNDDFNQIMYKGINVGKSLTQNLGIPMDELRQRMADGKVSFEDFRKALDQALPKDAVTEASNTIDNKIKTLEGAFRNLGFSILGVDFSKVDSGGQPLVQPGGLLDKMIGMMEKVSGWLKSPEVKQAFADIGSFAATAAGNVMGFVGWVQNLWNTLTAMLKPSIDELVKTYDEKLRPSVEELQPVFEAFGFILGMVIVGALILVIKALTWLVDKAAEVGRNIKLMGDLIAAGIWIAMGWVQQGIDRFNQFKTAVGQVWDFISRIDWGKAISGAAKGIGNSLIGLIEGAINGALKGLPGSPKISLPRFARGTNFAPGGLALVGEEGPEIVSIGRGSQVVNAQRTREILSPGRGGSVTIGEIHVHNEADEDRLIRALGMRLALR